MMLLSDLKIHVFDRLHDPVDLYFKNALSPNSINDYSEYCLKNNQNQNDYIVNLVLMLNHEDYFDIFMQHFNIEREKLESFIPYIKNAYTFDQIKIIHDFNEGLRYRGYRIQKDHCLILKNRYGSSASFQEKVLTENERIIKNIIE